MQTGNRGETGGSIRGEWPFAVIVTALFLLAAGVTVAHHEMWRDELQSWLVSRDSSSPLDVFRTSRYEGHPALWFLLIWPFTRLTDNPAVIQWLNLALAAGGVLLIARYAPAPRWLRAAASFGYFPLYEYGSIARNNAVALLALVAFCAAFPKRRERPLLIGAILFLAAHTVLPACILVIAAVLALAVETAVTPSARRPAAWAGLGIAAAGVATAMYQMNPPADTGFATGWNFTLSAAAFNQVLQTVMNGCLPLPHPGPGFWQSRLLDLLPGYAEWAWAGVLVLVALAALSLVRRPVALAYYLAGTLGLLAFFYVKTLGYLRHHGFLFVCLATALWMARSMAPVTLPGSLDGAGRWGERAMKVVLPLLLAVHVAGAALAAGSDYRHVFSAGKATAALIRGEGLDRLPLVADHDIYTVSVVGYLNKDRAFYPAGARYGSFVRWDRARYLRYDVWGESVRLAQELRSPVVIVVDGGTLAKKEPPPQLRPFLRLVGCRQGETEPAESFCVFLLGAGNAPGGQP